MAASNGNDVAKLYGSSGNDQFIARPFTLFASGSGTGLNRVMGFGGDVLINSIAYRLRVGLGWSSG